MQYLTAWKTRIGTDPDASMAASKKLLDTFSAWDPAEDGAKVIMQVSGLSGDHGWNIFEIDDPLKVTKIVAQFLPFLEMTVEPVIPVEDAVPIIAEAVQQYR